MQVTDDFANLTKSRSRPKVDPPHHSSSSSSIPVGSVNEIEKQRRVTLDFHLGLPRDLPNLKPQDGFNASLVRLN